MKVWKCSKKTKARQDTIIFYYRDLTGRESIPDDRQYWTMCGQCTYDDGSPNPYCELGQLLSEGLIKSNQFRGVEIDERVYELNRNAYPEIKFYLGDFCSCLLDSMREGFNPAIVNADLISMKDRAVIYLSRILYGMTYFESDVMILCNIVRKFGHNLSYDTIDEVFEEFNKNPLFREAMKRGEWVLPKKFYNYAGTGNTSCTGMTSFVFYKK